MEYLNKLTNTVSNLIPGNTKKVVVGAENAKGDVVVAANIPATGGRRRNTRRNRRNTRRNRRNNMMRRNTRRNNMRRNRKNSRRNY